MARLSITRSRFLDKNADKHVEEGGYFTKAFSVKENKTKMKDINLPPIFHLFLKDED